MVTRLGELCDALDRRWLFLEWMMTCFGPQRQDLRHLTRVRVTWRFRHVGLIIDQ